MTPGQWNFHSMCCAGFIASLLGFDSSRGAGISSGLLLGLRDLYARRQAGQSSWLSREGVKLVRLRLLMLLIYGFRQLSSAQAFTLLS